MKVFNFFNPCKVNKWINLYITPIYTNVTLFTLFLLILLLFALFVACTLLACTFLLLYSIDLRMCMRCATCNRFSKVNYNCRGILRT
jgi:hypothetical protein